jgi:transcriptional regulator with XRE-family HTH domain
MTRARKPAKKAATDKRGAALAKAIEDQAAELGLTQKDVAQRLGFSEPYYALLLSGQRWFGAVSEDKLKRIADFLDVPLLSVYMLAEVIHSEDFFRASSIEDQIAAALDAMARDKRFSTIIPTRADWSHAPLRVRLLCAILYQDVSGKDLLEKFRMLTIKDEED